MFGALNRFIGRLDGGQPEEEKNGLQGAAGFQVLKNTNEELLLEPWFDFIIGINGRTLDSADPNLFAQEIHNCAGTSISMGVFSGKGQRIREIYIQIPPSGSLGLSLQWTPLSAIEDVWHILDVAPDSPADVAGLLPYGDYVIGSPEGLLRGESGLGEIVEDYLNRPLRLQVYNHEYDVTRPVTITPSRGWGGTGALGCVLGFGALHRVPAPLDEPPQAPGEALFDAASTSAPALPPVNPDAVPTSRSPNNAPSDFQPVAPAASTDFLVPANMQFQSKSPPQTSPGSEVAPGRAKKSRGRAHHASPGAGLDDLLAEGEAKSKEQDFAPSGKPGSVPPPPGGPPKGPPRSGTPVVKE
ncbi:hypothetical protein EJ05DRAFT_507952 [Pseudovirgaria hyperparasitica]|uniref:PDZ GRASP-type domain-containing protein n=1 Tax=Pseudovirgaria hyperparasitica TaxID=470096 RepID=A0A6A6WDA9_9PEZI|nr:uncharacterized protein EJ05DRAFT_507952 [Pseudovirgaria hyperparasitica]KAF2760693.1 hypothetical protein EJ05DRAFT_507952 [Pseudovirgaria hyperparasitica]